MLVLYNLFIAFVILFSSSDTNVLLMGLLDLASIINITLLNIIYASEDFALFFPYTNSSIYSYPFLQLLVASLATIPIYFEWYS